MFRALKLNLSGKILILVAVPLAFELAFVFSLRGLLYQVEQEKARETYARDVSGHLSTILRVSLDMTVSSILSEMMRMRGYTASDNRQQAKLHLELERERADLATLVRGRPEQPKLEALEPFYEGINTSFHSTKEEFEKGNVLMAMKSWGQMQALQRRAFMGCEDIIAQQQVQQQTEIKAQGKAKELLYALLIYGAGLNVVLAIFLVYLFNRSTTRRLNLLLDNTIRLAQGRPLNPPLKGEDELAKLDHTFNQMAADLALATRKERAIVDKAMDVICSVDANNVMSRVSPAAERVWGYSPSALVGEALFDIMLPEDREGATKAIKAIKDIKNGSGDAAFENRVIKKDGKLIDMLWSARWSEEDKTLFCIAHDITERKQAENALKEASKLLRSVVERLPIGVAIIDASGVIEFTNPSINKTFALSSEELAGKSIAALFKTDMQSEPSTNEQAFGEKSASGQLIDGGNQKRFAEELFAKAKDRPWELAGTKRGGQSFPAEVNLTDFDKSTGDRYLVVVSDVTERHEIDRLRQEFMSMVGHDLRAPLTSIRGFLDLLNAGICGDLNEKGKKKLKAADGAMDSLLALIRDLLDIERAKAGMLVLDKKAMSFNTVVEQAINTVRIQADSLNITIQKDTSDLLIYADGDRIVQCMVNFLSNALKFSPFGSRIFITAQMDADWFFVRVRDQGRGIPLEFQDKIFDRFQQVKISDATTAGGSGLGLAICKAIIEQHGGVVGAESKEGQGSTFWFRIPSAWVQT